MEPTVPSTKEDKFLDTKIKVYLVDTSYTIDVYENDLGLRWVEALKGNLIKRRILEKNFCFLGFADTVRNLDYLCSELNKNIDQINSFKFDPPYPHIHPFVADDFQYSSKLKIGKAVNGDETKTPGLRLKHESCNLLHRYFEDLQGTAWKLSDYYRQADNETKYSIRQLNNLCHEIESWVISYRKKILEPEWIRPSQITTFLNARRFDLKSSDFELFKMNRYKRELGGVYLHWCQIGKTLYEVFRDEGGVKMDDATCSEINHQRYYSGEFDVEWGQTISEETDDWKRKEMHDFRQWLKLNNFEWDDPKLALGYAKIGQVNLGKTFGDEYEFNDVYQKMSQNLNITKIKVMDKNGSIECDYPYSLESDDWKKMQIKSLERGYESHS